MTKIVPLMLDEEAGDEMVGTLLDLRPWMVTCNFELLTDIADVKKLVDELIEIGICGLDTETTGLNTGPAVHGRKTDRIVGVCLAKDTRTGYYIPCRHIETEYNVPPHLLFKEIDRLTKNCHTVVHNGKFDFEMLWQEGVKHEDPTKFDDTYILAHVDNPTSKQKGLKYLSKTILKREMIDIQELINDKKVKTIDFASVNPKLALYYAASDPVNTLALYEHYFAQVEAWETGSDDDVSRARDFKVINDIEKKAQIVTREMERGLLKIDIPYLKSCREKVSVDLEKAKEDIYSMAGEVFDIASAQQLGTILFDKMKIPYPPDAEKTAQGRYKTGDEVLSAISNPPPIIAKIQTFREIEKLLSTYVDNMINNVDKDNYLKVGLNPLATDTGRFSASGGKGISEDGYGKINCQNIPSNYAEGAVDLRRSIIPEDDEVFVAIDYSGEELRIAANVSNEVSWINEFNHGSGDLHTLTARSMFGTHSISKVERGYGKTANFLTIYGGGAKRLSVATGLPIEKCKQMLEGFFDGTPGLASWLRTEVIRTRRRGYARTAFGRRRPVTDLLENPDKYIQSKADRIATNACIQGTGGDIIKLAMWLVWRFIRENGWQDDVKLVMPIHDEIVYRIKKHRLAEIAPELSKVQCMDKVLKDMLGWKVGLVSDIEWGHTFHVDHNLMEEIGPDGVWRPTPGGLVASHLEATKDSLYLYGGVPQEASTDEVPATEKQVESNSDVQQQEQQEQQETAMAGFDLEIDTEGPQDTPSVNPDAAAVTEEVVSASQILAYPITKTDTTSVAIHHLIWAILKQVDPVTHGPKKFIKLVDKQGVEVSTTKDKFSVDGFLALAVMYDI